jgi:hypothetical protein
MSLIFLTIVGVGKSSKDDFKDGNLFLNVETLANLTNPSYGNYKCLANIFCKNIQTSKDFI